MQETQVVTLQYRLGLVYLWGWAASVHLLLLVVCVVGVELLGRAIDRTALICLGIMPLAYWLVYGLQFRFLL